MLADAVRRRRQTPPAVLPRGGRFYEPSRARPGLPAGSGHDSGRRPHARTVCSVHGCHQADTAASGGGRDLSRCWGRLPEPEIVAEVPGAAHSRAGLAVDRPAPADPWPTRPSNPMQCRPPPWRLRESFTYDCLRAVLAIMGDKDIDATLQTLQRRRLIEGRAVTAERLRASLPSSTCCYRHAFLTADQIQRRSPDFDAAAWRRRNLPLDRLAVRWRWGSGGRLLGWRARAGGSTREGDQPLATLIFQAIVCSLPRDSR